METSDYQRQITEDVHRCIENMQCRPILFVGSGLSRRYLNLPDWTGLLEQVRSQCPTLDKELTYYLQRCCDDLPRVAAEFADSFQEFAWTKEGRRHFPPTLFLEQVPKDAYLKHAVATLVETISMNAKGVDNRSPQKEELELLKQIHPFAIITTNYDHMLEELFPQYEVTIGEQVLRADLAKIGDLLKIHGCISSPDTIVLTTEDFKDYNHRQKYLSAKLLTYFIEHPVLFLGYSASDSNIREILQNIDVILTKHGEQIANIYILNYNPRPPTDPPREVTISTEAERYVRIKQIETSDLSWVLRAFAHQSPIDIDIRILRALESKIQRLVRTDISNGTLRVDYNTLKGLNESTEDSLKIFGLSPIIDLSQSNAHYRHTISQVATILGFSYWHPVNLILKKIKEEKGVDLKSFDNKYHRGNRYGNSVFHEYSDDFVDIARKVNSGQEYSLEVPA